MKQIFEAHSVAIVRVFECEGNLGRNILQNLIDWGHQGETYCVNPKGGRRRPARSQPARVPLKGRA